MSTLYINFMQQYIYEYLKENWQWGGNLRDVVIVMLLCFLAQVTAIESTDLPVHPQCFMLLQFQRNLYIFIIWNHNLLKFLYKVFILSSIFFQQILYITVKVEDRDSINANDPMGKIRKVFTRLPAPNERSAKWNHVDFEFSYQT